MINQKKQQTKKLIYVFLYSFLIIFSSISQGIGGNEEDNENLNVFSKNSPIISRKEQRVREEIYHLQIESEQQLEDFNKRLLPLLILGEEFNDKNHKVQNCFWKTILKKYFSFNFLE